VDVSKEPTEAIKELNAVISVSRDGLSRPTRQKWTGYYT
jgi:hypothetical protein